MTTLERSTLAVYTEQFSRYPDLRPALLQQVHLLAGRAEDNGRWAEARELSHWLQQRGIPVGDASGFRGWEARPWPNDEAGRREALDRRIEELERERWEREEKQS